MKNRAANWIAFYSRHGDEVSMPFFFEGRPTVANVVSKIRKQPQLIEFVLPYAKPGMTPDENANAFIVANGIEGLVYTPFVNSTGDLRS